MKGFIHKFSIRTSFKREIFAGLLLSTLIPVFIVCILLVNISKSKIRNDYNRKCDLQLNSVLTVLGDYFNKIEALTDCILIDDEIIAASLKKDSSEQNVIYNRLYQITETLRDTAAFNIYSKNGECIFSTESYENIKYLPLYWGILKVALTHSDEFIIRKCMNPENEEIVLQTAKAIVKDEECIGFVVTDVKESDIEKIIFRNFDSSNSVTIVDEFYDEIYSSKTGTEKHFAKTIRDNCFSEAYYVRKKSGPEYLIKKINDTGLTLIMEKEPLLTDDMTRTMWGVSFTVGSLSLILCLFIASFFSIYMAHPVNKLSDAMEKIQSGNLDTVINSKRKDEFGKLSSQFNIMTSRLKKYMELQMQQQKELNEANIAMMQAQLNPHFLYNTLDTIKWVAKLNNVPQISKMSADLAKILRTSISSDKFVVITEELDLVSKYVEIQQIRFGGKFTFDYELPAELEDCVVPKLIIQPIVENALIHGLKEQDEGHIFINIFEKKCPNNKNQLNIIVSDDGCGIDEELCEKINTRNRNDYKEHIGFYNVDTILKLYYGNEYGIKVERLKEKGSSVTLVLPVQKNGTNGGSKC